MVGLVKPSTSHRVHKLDRGQPAYSLWLRGPKVAEIKLRGIGWPVCQEHGCDKVGVICWSCGGEGYRELYEEDPLWYDIDDVEPCDICRGEGGWLICPVCCRMLGGRLLMKIRIRRSGESERTSISYRSLRGARSLIVQGIGMPNTVL